VAAGGELQPSICCKPDHRPPRVTLVVVMLAGLAVNPARPAAVTTRPVASTDKKVPPSAAQHVSTVIVADAAVSTLRFPNYSSQFDPSRKVGSL